ncbi:hypothetical protein BT69DRAFT_1135513 [Atractiella rhizophila]|nr:hypothetical protein BT69DRAFT_1135513 [Atractiella rhizophila]
MTALAKAQGGPFNPVKVKKSTDSRGEKKETAHKKESVTLLAPHPPPFASATARNYGQIPSSPIEAASPAKRSRLGRGKVVQRRMPWQNVQADIDEEEDEEDEETRSCSPEAFTCEELGLDEEAMDSARKDQIEAVGLDPIADEDVEGFVYSEDDMMDDFDTTFGIGSSPAPFSFTAPGSPARKNRCITPTANGELSSHIFRTPDAYTANFTANPSLLFTPDPNSSSTPGIHERARSRSGQFRQAIMGSPRPTFKSSSPVRALRKIGYDEILYQNHVPVEQLKAVEQRQPAAWRSDYDMSKTPSDTPDRNRDSYDFMSYSGISGGIFNFDDSLENSNIINTPKGYTSYQTMCSEFVADVDD